MKLYKTKKIHNLPPFVIMFVTTIISVLSLSTGAKCWLLERMKEVWTENVGHYIYKRVVLTFKCVVLIFRILKSQWIKCSKTAQFLFSSQNGSGPH